MEKFSKEFFDNYKVKGDIDIVANTGGKKMLIPFFGKALIFLLFKAKRYDLIHLYDAVLFPLIPFSRLISKTKISITVNGLDIVFASYIYQRIMPYCLNLANKIFAISRYTMAECIARGITKEILITIPIGISIEALQICSELDKSKILSQLNIPSGKKILVSVGRLVKRKGHAWFIKNVFPRLSNNYIYIIIGDGPEFREINRVITEFNLSDRVMMLGRVSEAIKEYVYQVSYLFIMPNIRIEGDQEGFGIVLLEAGLYGVPVIASNIEGISDTVVADKTGKLVNEKNVQGFIDAITECRLNRSSIADIVSQKFDWKIIINKYHDEFRKIIIEK